MNGEVLQRIVEEIVSRLQRRAHSTATLSVAQLRDADCRSLFCQHASLRILLVDLPLLASLRRRKPTMPRRATFTTRWLSASACSSPCTASCCRLSRLKNWRACR
jgi:microcompartment protein PduM